MDVYRKLAFFKEHCETSGIWNIGLHDDNLNTLKEAKELPELFMKSKEEITLWRMLKRLSDRIWFDLDDRYLDKASKIEAYRIKDILIKLADHQLVITKGDEIRTLQMDDLLKQPTMVFKEILRVMG